jgi:hypothetical protein
MGRWRYRVRLEDGLKLDLNRLFLDAVATRGEVRRAVITWHRSSSGDIVVAGTIEQISGKSRSDGSRSN